MPSDTQGQDKVEADGLMYTSIAAASVSIMLSLYLLWKHWSSENPQRLSSLEIDTADRDRRRRWHLLHALFSAVFLVKAMWASSEDFTPNKYLIQMLSDTLYLTMWLWLLNLWLAYLEKKKRKLLKRVLLVCQVLWLLSPGCLVFLFWIVKHWSDRAPDGTGGNCKTEYKVYQYPCTDILFRLRGLTVGIAWYCLSFLTVWVGRAIWGRLGLLGLSSQRNYITGVFFVLPAIFLALGASFYTVYSVWALAYPLHDHGGVQSANLVVWGVFASLLPDYVPSYIAMWSLWETALGGHVDARNSNVGADGRECLEGEEDVTIIVNRLSSASGRIIGDGAEKAISDAVVKLLKQCDPLFHVHSILKQKNRSVTLEEMMQVAPCTMDAPALYARLLLDERMNQYQHWLQNSYATLMEKETDREGHEGSMMTTLTMLEHTGMVQDQQEEARRIKEHWDEHLAQIQATIALRAVPVTDQPRYFKASATRKQTSLAFLPVNMQWYWARLCPGDLNVERCVTVGCPAAHTIGFSDKRMKAPKRELHWSLQDLTETELQQLRAQDHRRSMAIASVCSAATQQMVACLEAGWTQRLEQYKEVGMCILWLSLLSTFGHENGMLQDMRAALHWVEANVTLVFEKAAETRVQSMTYHGGKIQVRISLQADEGSAPLPDDPIKPCMVFFTEGINEQQTAANTMHCYKEQDEINTGGLRSLQAYIASLKARNMLEGQSAVGELMASLKHHHEESKGCKDVTLLMNSTELALRMGAARLVSCKSAKDRTSMFVTHTAAVHAAEAIGDCAVPDISAKLRADGVRLENCELNTGKRHFAFNALQTNFLPKEFVPPTKTTNAEVET